MNDLQSQWGGSSGRLAGQPVHSLIREPEADPIERVPPALPPFVLIPLMLAIALLVVGDDDIRIQLRTRLLLKGRRTWR
jgi:hypothetical protein